MKGKLIKIKEHWETYCSVYICSGVFVFTTIVIACLAYSIIIRPEIIMDTDKGMGNNPPAIKVFINQNDTIMPRVLNDLQEVKGMIEEMKNDTLHVVITKGSQE